MTTATPDHSRPRSIATLIAVFTLSVIGVIALFSLGIWQVQRRAWKLDLIERVDARVHAPPGAAPAPSAWPSITSADAYRHIEVHGHFLNDRKTLVQASTDLGSGFWLLTPFQADRGFLVLINRGFVPPDWRKTEPHEASRIEGETTVTGLLRVSEPKGAFLRSNDPAQDRWYSRDIDAIATARNLGKVAPYFIDADAAPQDSSQSALQGSFPRGGLTVIMFPNNHLVYALTWFTLALMLAAWAALIARDEWRLRRIA